MVLGGAPSGQLLPFGVGLIVMAAECQGRTDPFHHAIPSTSGRDGFARSWLSLGWPSFCSPWALPLCPDHPVRVGYHGAPLAHHSVRHHE